MSRPHSVLEVRPDKVARICAWCPDKKQGDDWAEARNYDVTHSICVECQNREAKFAAMLEKGKHPLGGNL